MTSKTIILSKENEKGRGILTIFQEDDLLKCKIRLYNIPKLNSSCKIGIFHNNEVFSANLLEKEGVYLSSLVGNFDINQDFYTAIIDTSKNNEVIVSGGTYDGYFFNSGMEEIQNFEDTNLSENNLENNLKIDKVKEESNYDKCEDCNKCEKCMYKEYFYSQQNEKVEIKKEVEKTQKTEETQKEEFTSLENEKFEQLEAIKSQFKYVFENYPSDEILNTLIPNGKFVRIEENMNSYSIGAIYEEENLKVLCYAIPCNYNSSVPQELGEHYQWLPLDSEDPLSDGYYIVFQDATDLKIIEP